MSMVAVDFPEDHRVAVAAVMVHLQEIDHRQIVEAGQLAQAWMQVHHCDVVVLGALETLAGQEYRSIVEGPRRRARPARGWSSGSSIRTGVAHLRVAVHRRLMVVQSVLNEIA